MIFDTNEEANEFFQNLFFQERRLIILNFDGSIIINSQIFKNGNSEDDLSEDDYFWVYYGLTEDGNYVGGSGISQQINVELAGFNFEKDEKEVIVEFPNIYLGLITKEFKDVYFSNIGNTIYVNFGEISVPMITLSNRTQIVRVSEEYTTSYE